MEPLRRARYWVIGVAFAALVVKAYVAWTTIGQDDTYVLWPQFLRAVGSTGPYGIYGMENPGSQVYNHPPLAGWWLAAIDVVQGKAGVPTGFWIRIGSCVADFFCALVIFEMIAKRRALWQAKWAGILVGASPVLFVISGYHGNHDAEMMFFAILAGYLLVDRHAPVLAGLALAASISYKLPVLVAVPAIGIAALALGWATFWRFSAGFAGLTGVLWAPALINYLTPYINNVMLYKANSFPQQWGLVEFFSQTRLAEFFFGSYTEHGRFFLVAVCGLASAYVAWKRPDQVIAAVALATSVFLLFSPGYAPQYHVWPLAALFMTGFWLPLAYNLSTGAFLIWIYTAWSGGLPWDRAVTIGFTEVQVDVLRFVWFVLLAAVVQAALYCWRQTRQPVPGSLRDDGVDDSGNLSKHRHSGKLPAVEPSTA